MAPENGLDGNNLYQLVGTPSAECCSKRLFPTRVTRGFISNSRGIGKEVNSSPPVVQPEKQSSCLVSPTPPCGCQAQGFVLVM